MKIVVAIPSKSLNDTLLLEGVGYLNKLRTPFFAEALIISPKSMVSEDQKAKRMDLEGKELLQKTSGFLRVALSEEGKQLSSEGFAKLLETLMHRSSKLAFIIGGAFGLSEDVKSQCDVTLSLSSMTLPHRLAFTVLCEQLYRADEIRRGSPYHKH